MTVEESGKGQSLKASCRLLGYTRQAFYKQKRRVERKAILSIDMLTPAEAHATAGPLQRRWKNYYSANASFSQAMA